MASGDDETPVPLRPPLDPEARAETLQREMDRASRATPEAIAGDARLAALRRLIHADDGPKRAAILTLGPDVQFRGLTA